MFNYFSYRINDWFKFKKLFTKNGGDFFYSAWKPTYFEPFFKKYKKIGNCPIAEYSQKRIIQLKTNYWNKNCEESIIWNDSDLKIDWPLKELGNETLKISSKDKDAKTFQSLHKEILEN